MAGSITLTGSQEPLGRRHRIPARPTRSHTLRNAACWKAAHSFAADRQITGTSSAAACGYPPSHPWQAASNTRPGDPLAADGAASELPWAVDVGAVFDGHDVDAPVLVVDAVYPPVVAAAGAVQPVEPELERLADPVRAGRERPVQELDRRGGNLLGQPGQRTAGRCRPCDRVVALVHRSAIRRSASSLVSAGGSEVPSSARASRMSSRSAALPMTSRVSSKDSRSSTLMTTAAGWPCLVITTRPCSRSRRSTTSESRFFTSARGICSLTDIAISIASFSGLTSGRSLDGGHRCGPRLLPS